MRLLQLATGPNQILDLHPLVTIVTGLDHDTRALLVDAVTRLARAEAADGGGLLEAHGMLFGFDSGLLSVIERAPDDLDPIVYPGQLPSQPISVDARELRRREQAFSELLDLITLQAEKQSLARGALVAAAAALDEARRARADAEGSAARRRDDIARLTRRLDQLAEQRQRVTDELRELRPALAAAQAARAEVERRTAGEREHTEEVVALRSAIEAELAEIDAMLDGSAPAEVERARIALQELQDPPPVLVAHGEAALLEPLAVRLERLEGRSRALDDLLTVVVPVERFAIEEALAMLEGGESSDLVPSGEAAALADELDRIGAELGDPAAVAGDEVEAASLGDARTRLDDARHLLLEAEQAVRNPQLDGGDVARLEDTHAKLLEAGDKVERRFAGARATRRLVELRAAEQVVLDQLGFTSYSDYMMGDSLHEIDPALDHALAAARAELAAAEGHWHKLERDADAALARAALLDRRRELFEQARELLGRVAPGGRPQEALRSLRVPTVSTRDSAQRLHAMLETVGVELGDEELDHEELALIAEAWLDEVDQVDGRRRAALEERAVLQADRDALVLDLDAEGYAGIEEPAMAQLQPTDADREQLRLERLAEAHAALVEAERRQAASQAAEARRAGVVVDLATAREMEASAAEASAEADAEISTALAAETPLAERISALDEELVRAHRDAAEADEALRGRSEAVPDAANLDAMIEAAEARHAQALAGVESEDRALAALDAEGRAAALEIERLQDIVTAQGTGTATPAEELEWYLLARLAAQRSVSVAGSVPLLLDDALRGLATDEVGHLLGRLERMAEAVQVIVLSEDPVAASWAEAAGPARAAVVSPGAP